MHPSLLVRLLCAYLHPCDIALQMAKRVPQTPDIDGATAAFKRVSLGSPTTQLRTPSGGPGSYRPIGMAARRNKPLFKLSDITGEQEPGGGASGAGPAPGSNQNPTGVEWPPRRPVVTNTPFASFGKIVYVLLVLPRPTVLRLYLWLAIHRVRSTFGAKQSFTPQALTFPMAPLSPSTWLNSNLVKSSVTVPTVPSSESFTDPPTWRWR